MIHQAIVRKEIVLNWNMLCFVAAVILQSILQGIQDILQCVDVVTELRQH